MDQVSKDIVCLENMDAVLIETSGKIGLLVNEEKKFMHTSRDKDNSLQSIEVKNDKFEE